MALLRPGTLHVVAMCLLLWLTPASSSVAAEGASPQEVKAAFLYNFLKFVDWPAAAFATPKSPYVVGILGRDPFGKVLDETFDNKPLNGRNVVVKRISEADAAQCHLVFISSSEHRRLAQILERLQTQPVLTVGDSPDFATTGGIINFYQAEKKIRFEVNMDAAKRANLKLHSTLLNLAKIVRDR